MTITATTAALLDIGGLADYLGVDRSTIWRWRQQDSAALLPPVVRLGTQLRWRPATVDRWLDEREAAA
jgi:predicted DNA-binding transcriptional regulator AlpA